MEEIYENVEYGKPVGSAASQNDSGPRSSQRRFDGAVVLSLGLLSVGLLAGLIGLGFHYQDSMRRSAADFSIIINNLTQHLQASHDQLSTVLEERDLLNASLTETRKELHSLSTQNQNSMRRSAANFSNTINNLTQQLQASHDQLSTVLEERDLLNANLTKTRKELHSLRTQKRTCPTGWTLFMSSCYHLSMKSGSWMTGREDCRTSGADLVVINSTAEQKFLCSLTEQGRDTWAWIGLTDRDSEGTWKWIDGTALILRNWEAEQPDNGGGSTKWGEEDCAHMKISKKTEQNWNDLSCDASQRWICEKSIGS